MKLFAKLQAVKAELQDIQEAHSKERQDLEQNQNELTRDLKLKWVCSDSWNHVVGSTEPSRAQWVVCLCFRHLIIDNFIPFEVKNRTMSRAFCDEEDETWKLKPIARVDE